MDRAEGAGATEATCVALPASNIALMAVFPPSPRASSYIREHLAGCMHLECFTSGEVRAEQLNGIKLTHLCWAAATAAAPADDREIST